MGWDAEEGSCVLPAERIAVPLYRHQTGRAESLPYNDVNCFAEDGKGNLWIGTDGGGLIYFDRAGNRWLQYRQ
ncbi:two-component regulator propeller domain-containing protein [Puia sp. P3]|uniref:two-component regulator propeller domain-containing protein n=1 Tax=Puia sp. P3 TaxID=3423952 RepID=UPI003D676F7A